MRIAFASICFLLLPFGTVHAQTWKADAKFLVDAAARFEAAAKPYGRVNTLSISPDCKLVSTYTAPRYNSVERDTIDLSKVELNASVRPAKSSDSFKLDYGSIDLECVGLFGDDCIVTEFTKNNKTSRSGIHVGSFFALGADLPKICSHLMPILKSCGAAQRKHSVAYPCRKDD